MRLKVLRPFFYVSDLGDKLALKVGDEVDIFDDSLILDMIAIRRAIPADSPAAIELRALRPFAVRDLVDPEKIIKAEAVGDRVVVPSATAWVLIAQRMGKPVNAALWDPSREEGKKSPIRKLHQEEA